MTPAERAVIDAARALAERWAGWPTSHDPVTDALLAAVRALPRPLSEQLAELRPGAVVASGSDENCYRVLANIPSHSVAACEYMDRDKVYTALVPYRLIRRIISNPEASNG